MVTKTCRDCGASDVQLEPVYEYPWDGSDTEGSIKEFAGHQCVDRRACRERQRTQRVRVSIPDDTYSRGTGQGWGHQQ